jgi:hypothetical protein
VTRSHYRDVVEPFRRRHPDYQRRWRLVSKLREIRDEITSGAQVVGERLAKVLAHSARVMGTAAGVAQVRAKTGTPLEAALAVAAELVSAMKALTAQVSALGLLG